MDLLQEQSLHWGCLKRAGVEVNTCFIAGEIIWSPRAFGSERNPQLCI
jgi:hypothetical protein